MNSDILIVDDYKDCVRVNNIKLFNYVILYTVNCEVLIVDRSSEKLFVPCGSLILLEKNSSFDVLVKRKGNGLLYEMVEINDDMVNSLRNIYDIRFDLNPFNLMKKRNVSEKHLFIDTNDLVFSIFKNYKDSQCDVYEMAFLLSKVNNVDALKISLSINVITTLSDKIRWMIEEDIGKKWKIMDIADKLHVSEVAVRKRLELEGKTFNCLILDIKMNASFKCLVCEGKNIDTISSLMGFSSTSYFIKIFKSYYGVTPKQLLLNLRDAIIN